MALRLVKISLREHYWFGNVLSYASVRMMMIQGITSKLGVIGLNIFVFSHISESSRPAKSSNKTVYGRSYIPKICQSYLPFVDDN